MLLRSLFISLYAVAGMRLLIELWQFIHLPFDRRVEVPLYSVWLGVCFSSYRWLSSFYLSVNRVRKTILEEEEWLHPLMHELSLRSSIHPVPEVLVLEKPELNAYAVGRKTVVVSRGLLVTLSEPEIRAVFAHEFGHLRDRDTRAATAFSVAGWIPSGIYRILHTGSLFIKKWFWNKGSWPAKLLFIVLAGLAFFHYPDGVILSLLLFIFMKGFPYVQLGIQLIWCYFSRVHEFRQDGFAYSLGCGKHLKSALLKMDALNSGTLVNRITEFWMTHPLLYRRIRRIEWLEGLRPTP